MEKLRKQQKNQTTGMAAEKHVSESTDKAERESVVNAAREAVVNAETEAAIRAATEPVDNAGSNETAKVAKTAVDKSVIGG